MTRAAQSFVILAMLVCMVFIASYSYTAFLFFSPPLTTIGTLIENPEVKLGDPLVMKQAFHRNRYCKTDVDRFIIRQSDDVLVRRERFAAPAGALGDSVVRILIATKFPENVGVIVGISDLLRQDLQIGERYIIRMFIHSDCGDRTHSLPVVPDMVFKVIE